ncbi:MAG: peptide deformylase [Gemmatimonadetes bacterium]|nr:peptide deformylase [Gemmatimonadota bacterium]
MAILDIRKYGDPVLLAPTKPVDEIDAELERLIEDMIDTMYAADGVGLAANQVGVSRRFAVFDLAFVNGLKDEDLLVTINPRIVAREGSQIGEEGCLSLPGMMADIERPMKVTVRAMSMEGEENEIEGEGLLARAFCHEIEHLEGKLFIDNLAPNERGALLREYRARL